MTVTDDASLPTIAGLVCDALIDAGVEYVFGLPGTQTLPIDRELANHSDLTYVMARHETAIPHMAWGHYEASNTPAATLTVPGPGDTNAMHGLRNALDDRVPIVHISADVAPTDRHRRPIHEIDPHTFDSVVKENVVIERRREVVPAIERAIANALSPPRGPVRLGIPSSILDTTGEQTSVSVSPETTSVDNAVAYKWAVSHLVEADRPVLYVGNGARRSDEGVDAILQLVEQLSVPVLASYKGKGVVPEDDPRFLGVTASHLPAGAVRVLERADVVCALGATFDGVTTAGWSLPMGEQLIHATREPALIDAAYPADVAIIDDPGKAAARLGETLDSETTASYWDGAAITTAVREEYEAHWSDHDVTTDTAHTPAVLRALREVLPREAIVTNDVGGYALWAKHVFEAYTPETFIAPGAWSGMGVALPAAIGAALGAPDRPTVCCIGDGGVLMCLQELQTAVELDLDLVIVVFNNHDYGIISKSTADVAFENEPAFGWTSPAFTTIAEGFGCRTDSASTPAAAADALVAALEADGPVVIDVTTDPHEPSPVEGADYDSTIELP